MPLGDALTAHPHTWRGTHLLTTALLHARTQAICLLMRINTNRGWDPACRALRYMNNVVAAGVDVFMILQEEEPELFERQPSPRGGAS